MQSDKKGKKSKKQKASQDAEQTKKQKASQGAEQFKKQKSSQSVVESKKQKASQGAEQSEILAAKNSSLQALFDSRNAALKDFPRETLKRKKEVPVEAEPSPKKMKQDQPNRSVQRDRKKAAKLRGKEEEERLSQTLFVGNLPVGITRKGLEKLFNPFGIVMSVRLRGAIPVKSQISKKVAEITRKYHDGLHSRKGFVVFKDAEGATAALELNGTLVDDHHIIVDRASGSGEKKTYDKKRSVFVGNLPFDADDEDMWNAFSALGEVEAVRVVRDKTTGAGKGFGYVLFRDESSKQSALSTENVEMDGRKLRVKPVDGHVAGQKHKKTRALRAKTYQKSGSRKSGKKLLKREKVKREKKKIAESFKSFL